MKVIIAGTRTIEDYQAIYYFIDNYYDKHPMSRVVSGCADGVDSWGERWAFNWGIPLDQFHADWKQYGKKAGIRRNIEMGNYADALLAIWDGKSRGTRHMIDYMLDQGKPVTVEIIQCL